MLTKPLLPLNAEGSKQKSLFVYPQKEERKKAGVAKCEVWGDKLWKLSFSSSEVALDLINSTLIFCLFFAFIPPWVDIMQSR